MKARSVLALLAALTACRAPLEERSLLPLLPDAETRSDDLDLPLLHAHGHLDPGGFAVPEAGASPFPLRNRGPVSRITLPFGSRADKELRLRVRGRGAAARPLAVSLNRVAIGEVLLSGRSTEATFALPAAVQQEGPNTLRLGTGERRSWVLEALDVRPAGRGRPAPPGPAGDAWWLPAGSSTDLHLHLDAEAELRLAAEAPGAGARLTAALAWEGGERVLADTTVAAGAGRRAAAALERLPGAFARLRLTNAGPGGLRLRELSLAAPPVPLPSPPAPARLPGRPSVFVFLADALRADVLGAYGGPAAVSPRFDAFAREALVFEDAGAQASWTRPATASIFTGLHPGSHGVGALGSVLVPGITTLAESLADAGYRTGAFVANSCLNVRFGFGQGFSVWNPGPQSLKHAASEVLVEHALRWLDEGRGPAFVYIHTLDPHAPYEPAPADAARFEVPGYRGERRGDALLSREHLEPDELAHLRSLYLAEAHGSDRAFGALLDGLRQREQLDGGIVVFTADHGEEFQEHGGLQHGYTVYREVIRVPLAVRLPRARRGGQRVDLPVDEVDLFPTLAALLGTHTPATEGRDLSAAWLQGASVPTRPRVVESTFGHARKGAVRSGDLELIANDDARNMWRAGTARELYDLRSDPGERRDLLSSRPLAAGYLAQALRTARREHEAVRAHLAAGAVLELSEAEREELRALGYVQ